jgi:glycosyltransferase involved in cell wall biosynthesis
LDWLTVGEHEQGVLFLTPEPAELTQLFFQSCGWVRLGCPFAEAPVKYAQIINAVRGAVRDFKPDLVVAWPAGWSHWIHLGSRLAAKPRLLTHAGTAPGKGIYARFLYTWFSLGIGRLCGHHVVACTHYVQDSYTSLPFLSRSHIRFAYNCCRVARFVKTTDEVVRVGSRVCMVGSLEKSKDYPTLLRAWQLVELDGKYELHIAGGGSRKGELESLAHQLGLKRVRFLGPVDDVPSLLWSSHVFAFSANMEEGFGTVLIEALAAGCKIVSADVPACREVLQGGRFGVLVPPQSPQALAAAILDSVRRPSATAEIASGIGYAKGFSAENMVRDYLGIAFGNGVRRIGYASTL